MKQKINNEEVEMAICKRLPMKEFEIYSSGIFKSMPR
jgi:hypothetical protein